MSNTETEDAAYVRLKPPIGYHGSKMRRAPSIVALLPEHKSYVEPFAGGLSVLLAKEPSKLETVNDIDGNLVHFWRVLRDRPDELARVCELTPYARDELDLASGSIGEWPDLDDMERARRVWVMLTQGFGSKLRRSGWQAGRAYNTDPASHMRTFQGRLLPAAQRLSGVQIENRDALEVISKHGVFDTTCIYADPPYLGHTLRTGRKTEYSNDMVSEESHRALAEVLNACRASVVLSGYHSPLYDELYEGWDVVETETTASRGKNRARTEVLWIKRAVGTSARRAGGLF